MEHLTPRRTLVLAAALAALVTLVACGSSGGSSRGAGGNVDIARRTAIAATAIASASPTPAQTSGLANEGGRAPVFYRTADDFASLMANQPYKVVFRITNGYAADMLAVAANCSSCSGAPPSQTFQGVKVQPVGEEATGSFYPVNLLLRVAGRWEVTVHAGADSVTIPVDVKPAP